MTIDRAVLGAVLVAVLTGVAHLLVWQGGMDARVAAIERAESYYHGDHDAP